jgi:hypothetical protein
VRTRTFASYFVKTEYKKVSENSDIHLTLVETSVGWFSLFLKKTIDPNF